MPFQENSSIFNTINSLRISNLFEDATNWISPLLNSCTSNRENIKHVMFISTGFFILGGICTVSIIPELGLSLFLAAFVFFCTASLIMVRDIVNSEERGNTQPFDEVAGGGLPSYDDAIRQGSNSLGSEAQQRPETPPPSYYDSFVVKIIDNLANNMPEQSGVDSQTQSVNNYGTL